MKSDSNNSTLGIEGENLAAKYLIDHGYQILHRNWRYKHKEIDIIALIDNTLVVVEVKSRTDNYWGNPEEFVTKQKQAFLTAAAEAYITSTDFDGDCRFDVIAVLFHDRKTDIQHIVNAFYP